MSWPWPWPCPQSFCCMHLHRISTTQREPLFLAVPVPVPRQRPLVAEVMGMGSVHSVSHTKSARLSWSMAHGPKGDPRPGIGIISYAPPAEP
jgi:hypothetical protein